jgi:LPPG:FO 2-phospho-L-lactate transferase
MMKSVDQITGESMKVAALAGGVGGAKLADGLAQSQQIDELTVIVNTGDDFRHFGLDISPDLDTVCYNLAGIQDPGQGWGRNDERWETLEEIRRLGGPDWFQLGNRDLGTHLERTRRLAAGESLSEITNDFCDFWGISARVLPMSDDPVGTIVESDQGPLPFQDYFVRLACRPTVSGFQFSGVENARPAPGVLESLADADLVVICPSNPWVSIDPILAVPGIRSHLEGKFVLAVSPIIDGQTVKGPAAKMYREMGIEPSARAVLDHYGDLLSLYIIDAQDAGLGKELTEGRSSVVPVHSLETWMKTRTDRKRLAEEILEICIGIVEEG